MFLLIIEVDGTLPSYHVICFCILKIVNKYIWSQCLSYESRPFFCMCVSCVEVPGVWDYLQYSKSSNFIIFVVYLVDRLIQTFYYMILI